ncbi:MAG: NAD+ synthase [Acidobacteriota bacterium]
MSLAQINPKTGDLRGNAARIVQGIEAARREGAHLVVFPEMCLTGYCLDEKLLINRQFLRENRRILMEEIRQATRGIAAVVGFVDFDESRRGPDAGLLRHNAAAILQDGELLQVVHKRLLPAYRYFDDKRYFTPGRRVDPVELDWAEGRLRLGVLICEDLWDEAYELKPARILREKGAELLVAVSASPFVASTPGRRDGKRFVRNQLIERKIAELGVAVVSVNTVGVGDNGKNIIPFDGASTAHDASGRLVAHLASFAPEQLTVEFTDWRADPVPEPPFDREGEIFEALVMGVRDYFDKVGIFEGVLEAVSGGIDSALGAAIAHAAVGPERLFLYNLPSRYNSPETQAAARQLAANLGVSLQVIPIQGMVDRIVADFEKHLHPIVSPLTLENIQARVRGLIMMAESNDRRALLLTNGNETELALGYATLYGDMVGGLAVIGDLSKPDVYRVARYVNRRWGREVIPREIFDLPPSAELKDGQRDPFDYDVVGPVVSDFVERGMSPSELVERFRRRELPENRYGLEVYERYDVAAFRELAYRLYRTMNRAVYKRMQAAPIIVVSERSFGFDLRETIINGWDG